METSASVKSQRILIRWLRGEQAIDISDPLIVYFLGRRGGGKSVGLEVFGEMYMEEGHNVLDLFGSSDGEGLAWLRSPWVKEQHLPALLVRGEAVEVGGPYPSKCWRDVTLDDLEANRIVVSSSPLYASRGEEYEAATSVLDLLFQRGGRGWSKKIYVLVREAANLFYSRVKVAGNQLDAKARGIYLMRESRHHGLSLGLDSQKQTSVDSDFRALCDFIFFKSMGIDEIPDELRFVYRYLSPQWLRDMAPWDFGVVAGKGPIGFGVNDYTTWHKRDREHIIRALGITIKRPETRP